MSALLIALAVGLGVDAADHKGKPARPLAPPSRVSVPVAKNRPLFSNPQVSFDGKRVWVARAAVSGSRTQGLEVMAIALAAGGKAETVDFPVPVNGNQVRILLSNNDKYLAVLSQGELWIKTLGEVAEPRRLYPPAQGETPLGSGLSQASFGPDSTWLLVKSPMGWGRLAVATSEFQGLSLPSIDLSGPAIGCLAMSSDGFHAILVKPQAGQGYLNGSPVLALNISTGFAQGLNTEHLYSEVLFLPDGHPLGKDAAGALWLLRPKSRLAYFTPPKAPKHSTIDGYAINFAATKLAWTVTTDLEGKSPHAELWVAGAPPTPEPPKVAKAGED
jgi:hypothetical protein